MAAEILDGKLLANQIKARFKEEVSHIKEATHRVPTVVNIMVGDDPCASAYANSQKKDAEYIGINYKLTRLPSEVSQDEIIHYVQELNKDPEVNGIMIHKPVPLEINYWLVVNCITPEKDLEGINPTNIGKMIIGKPNIVPCTPAAVLELIKSVSFPLRGKEAVIIGHSEIVGKPLSLLLLEQFATVTICHVATNEAGRLSDHVRRAEILIVAVGKPAFIKGEWIKEGAMVIDVGINKVEEQIVGDVEFESARKKAAYITPVPGGVGPLTVVMLLRNSIEAFKLQG